METIRAKFAADVRSWAVAWQKQVSIALVLRLIAFEPGFQLSLALRINEGLRSLPRPWSTLLCRLCWYAISRRFHCDIDSRVPIGAGVRFPHPYGIVIGGACRIGCGVIILQHVTLGRVRSAVHEGPTICNNVEINAGAVVAGAIVIGDSSTIGANAFINQDVPAGTKVGGVPGRVLMPRSAI